MHQKYQEVTQRQACVVNCEDTFLGMKGVGLGVL